jgi:hypothetical protein
MTVNIRLHGMPTRRDGTSTPADRVTGSSWCQCGLSMWHSNS